MFKSLKFKLNFRVLNAVNKIGLYYISNLLGSFERVVINWEDCLVTRKQISFSEYIVLYLYPPPLLSLVSLPGTSETHGIR